MQNPEDEIERVLGLLFTSVSPDIQQGAIKKYFVEDAAFRSPFFHIPSGPSSREEVLGIYQWQRVMSLENKIDITKVVFDKDSSTIYAELTQLSNIRFSPFKPVPCNILLRLKLRKRGEHYKITSQEDFYHPDDFLKRVIPPFALPLRAVLCAASYVSVLSAKTAQVLGFWRVGDQSTPERKTLGNNGPHESGKRNGSVEDGGWQTSKKGKHH